MKSIYLTLPAIALLAACGGGGGDGGTDDPMDPPTPPSNPAVPDDAVVVEPDDEPASGDVDEVFDLPTMKLIASDRRDGDRALSQLERQPGLSDQDYTVTFNSDGTVTLTQGTLSVDLALSGADDTSFQGNTGQGIEDEEFEAFFERRFKAGDVETALLIASDFNERVEGFIVVGELADAGTVAGRTGTATFGGFMNARITGPFDAADAPGTPFTAPINGLGSGSLSVDFAGGTVSGEFNVADPANFRSNVDSTATQFPRVRVLLDESSITGNGFGGTASIAFTNSDASDDGLGTAVLTPNADGSYTGNFYGDAAGSAGGTVSSTFDNAGETFVFQGGFAAAE